MSAVYPDPVEVERISQDILKQNGYLVIGRGGEVREDKDKLIDDVYEHFTENCVATSKGEIARVALTKAELYDTIYTQGPRFGAWANVNEQTVLTKFATKLWTIAAPSMTSQCNIRAAAEGLTLVLCEAPVSRTYPPSLESGKATRLTDIGRFFTDNGDLILQFSTQPMAHKLTKSAEATSKHFSAVLDRHPEIGGQLGKQASQAIKTAQTHLAPITGAGRAQQALPEGQTEG